MTSTTETAGHPDVAEISDLTEGLLEPSRAADVRRHLDECELCADVNASLEEIRGLLGTLPGPPRMPADVASRIDAALAAEALLHATAPEAVEPQPPVAATIQLDSSTVSDGSARVSRETSATADRPSGRAHVSTTGPGRKRKKGSRRRGVVLGAVFTAAALGFGSVLLSSMNDGKPSGPEAGGQHSTSADTFAEGKLEKQVTDLLATRRSGGSGSRSPHTLGAESVPGNEPKILQDPIPVPGCVQKGIGRSDSALASEPGTYKGTDALLVVLPDTSDTSRVMAYIMDTACVADPTVGKAKVLLKQSYARS
ncbi:hypothetical protein ABZ027_05980 [Streptomyces sp. NPDC006332]|uniref:anti-sigma factor family protein n=1 Tax=Streptomyces sp. NPDC006332 TaxID=3155456 RepID=UPI00339E26F1